MTDRTTEHALDIKTTAEQAFEALVEPERLRAWLVDNAESDPTPGGRYRWTWAAQLDDISEGEYLEVDRPRRLVTRGMDKDAPGPLLATYTFEDLGGGVTRVRVVNSGFGSGPEWDEALERFREGVVHFLKALKRHLEEGFDRRRMARLGLAFGPGDGGRRVEAVIDSAPAARAGIVPGDIVINLDGQPIDDFEQIARFLVERSPGDTVSITLLRDGKSYSTSVDLYGHYQPVGGGAYRR
ncbi:MAG TPA: SRPBCC domain-containing protein [Candidatus Limnocylindrales bacterium]|jgi:uncharacterized protein YndB with AHSA1/START domain|nr:SRPBCC domain-containing protein [Candidatus Limnocylindrales bacterium]